MATDQNGSTAPPRCVIRILFLSNFVEQIGKVMVIWRCSHRVSSRAVPCRADIGGLYEQSILVLMLKTHTHQTWVIATIIEALHLLPYYLSDPLLLDTTLTPFCWVFSLLFQWSFVPTFSNLFLSQVSALMQNGVKRFLSSEKCNLLILFCCLSFLLLYHRTLLGSFAMILLQILLDCFDNYFSKGVMKSVDMRNKL